MGKAAVLPADASYSCVRSGVPRKNNFARVLVASCAFVANTHGFWEERCSYWLCWLVCSDVVGEPVACVAIGSLLCCNRITEYAYGCSDGVTLGEVPPAGTKMRNAEAQSVP